MQLNYINGAVDMTLDDGRRAWFPPAFFRDIAGPGMVVTNPYWTNIYEHWCGPDFDKKEIEQYYWAVWKFYLGD